MWIERAGIEELSNGVRLDPAKVRGGSTGQDNFYSRFDQDSCDSWLVNMSLSCCAVYPSIVEESIYMESMVRC